AAVVLVPAALVSAPLLFSDPRLFLAADLLLSLRLARGHGPRDRAIPLRGVGTRARLLLRLASGLLRLGLLVVRLVACGLRGAASDVASARVVITDLRAMWVSCHFSHKARRMPTKTSEIRLDFAVDVSPFTSGGHAGDERRPRSRRRG